MEVEHHTRFTVVEFAIRRPINIIPIITLNINMGMSVMIVRWIKLVVIPPWVIMGDSIIIIESCVVPPIR
jgi:hypothetical protein|tara:strand:+ start:265 stop:474 length:210 start_codon:yes stop_codon:yes gene_type:complete